MKTINRAQTIIEATPREALADAIGLAAIALLIFGGFLAPALL